MPALLKLAHVVFKCKLCCCLRVKSSKEKVIVMSALYVGAANNVIVPAILHIFLSGFSPVFVYKIFCTMKYCCVEYF